jgi:hypothetical protein
VIPISDSLRDILGGQELAIYPKVEASARDPDGFLTPFLDLTDRLVTMTVRASIDDAARRFSATFARGLGAESLSPFVTQSAYNAEAPLLAGGNVLQLSVAIVPPGVTPSPGDYRQIERLRIDRVNAADGIHVTVSGRDLTSAYFLDAFIQETRAYGSAGGTAVELVIFDPGPTGTRIGGGRLGRVAYLGSAGSIISDWASYNAVLTLPNGSPNWFVRQYAQREGSVLEACRALALQIGWDLRSFPRSSNDLELFFYDPERERIDADAVLPQSEYLKVSNLTVDDADVRNQVEVWFGQASTRERVRVEDQASINQYGPRFMRIVEDVSSNIDTLAEATTLATAALADLKDPLADHQVETFLWPFVELNDVHAYPANDEHYDRDQRFAVVGYQHTIAKGGGRTTIQTRGKPLAAYRAYRRGTPRTTHIAIVDPPLTGTPEQEGAIWFTVDSLDFPA